MATIASLKATGGLDLKGEMVEVPSSLIGNRNFVKETSTPLILKGTDGANGNTGTPANSNFGRDPYPLATGTFSQLGLKVGDVLKLSYDWSAQGTNISGSFRSEFNASPWIFGNDITLSSSNNKGRFEYSVIITSGNAWITSTAQAVRFRGDNIPVGNTVTITNLKFEFSSVTDWTQAPEDLGIVLDKSIRVLSTNSFSENGLLVKELVEVPVALKGGRNLVEETNTPDTMGSKNWRVGGWGYSAGAILGTETVENDNGQKCLVYTSTVATINPYVYWTTKYQDYKEARFPLGMTVMISLEVMCSIDCKSYATAEGITGGIGQNYDVKANVWKKIYHTFTINNYNSSQGQSPRITFGAMFSNNGQNFPIGTVFKIRKLKVEKGNIATPWTVAPEDININLPLEINTLGNPISMIADSYTVISGEITEGVDL